MTRQLSPVLNKKSLENTYRYGGGTVRILIAGEDTGGAFSMWESVQKPGSEPPLHMHRTSDETFYILEGSVDFQIGDEIRAASAGDVAFAPRGIPHTFRIRSHVARAITICRPAGFEDWFRKLGERAMSFDLPEEVTPFPESDLSQMLALSKHLRVEILQQEVKL